MGKCGYELAHGSPHTFFASRRSCSIRKHLPTTQNHDEFSVSTEYLLMLLAYWGRLNRCQKIASNAHRCLASFVASLLGADGLAAIDLQDIPEDAKSLCRMATVGAEPCACARGVTANWPDYEGVPSDVFATEVMDVVECAFNCPALRSGGSQWHLASSVGAMARRPLWIWLCISRGSSESGGLTKIPSSLVDRRPQQEARYQCCSPCSSTGYAH